MAFARTGAPRPWQYRHWIRTGNELQSPVPLQYLHFGSFNAITSFFTVFRTCAATAARNSACDARTSTVARRPAGGRLLCGDHLSVAVYRASMPCMSALKSAPPCISHARQYSSAHPKGISGVSRPSLQCHPDQLASAVNEALNPSLSSGS